MAYKNTHYLNFTMHVKAKDNYVNIVLVSYRFQISNIGLPLIAAANDESLWTECIM